jgi:hypothetical protein
MEATLYQLYEEGGKLQWNQLESYELSYGIRG